ncbi:MAG: NosD domain-containing protein [Pseudomonadota bacterium]
MSSLFAADVRAAGTYTIRDDATGGQCGAIGTWNPVTKTCTLTTDVNGTVGITSNGITLDGNGHELTGPRLNGGLVFNTSGVTVRNLTVRGFWNGILVSGGSNNVLVGNTLVENEYGIYIDASHGNVVTDNHIAYNVQGIYVEFANNNIVYHNSFEVNGIQASVYQGTGNSFNLPAPIGGNYWDDFDEPADGCLNGNADKFCDSPYVFSGGQDNLPITTYDAWCQKSDLRLYKTSVFWASFSDYTTRRLSVSYKLRNLDNNAYAVAVTGSTATNGVTSISTFPVPLGDVPAGTWSAPFTLRYQIPSGVGGFTSRVSATALDGCGNVRTYP